MPRLENIFKFWELSTRSCARCFRPALWLTILESKQMRELWTQLFTSETLFRASFSVCRHFALVTNARWTAESTQSRENCRRDNVIEHSLFVNVEVSRCLLEKRLLAKPPCFGLRTKSWRSKISRWIHRRKGEKCSMPTKNYKIVIKAAKELTQ